MLHSGTTLQHGQYTIEEVVGRAAWESCIARPIASWDNWR